MMKAGKTGNKTRAVAPKVMRQPVDKDVAMLLAVFLRADRYVVSPLL